MRLGRRQFLRLLSAVAAVRFASGPASALDYPTWPVRMIVPLGTGGAVDIIARLIAQRLSERLGQPIIVENRPGAGTNIATEAVVRSPADAYTLLLLSPPAAINATLYDKLNFSVIRDIAPVASLARAPFVMEINPSLPARSVPELIAYAKANPGKINMGTVGIGSGPHLAGELFKMMAGVNVVPVSYKGSGAELVDLMSGEVQMCFDAIPGSIEFIKANKLRALAVTTGGPSDVLPEVPTLGEFLPGYEASFWVGLGAPKKTPAEIIDNLNTEINTEINAALADPTLRTRLASSGAAVLAGSPSDFEELITAETEKWAKVIRTANLRPE